MANCCICGEKVGLLEANDIQINGEWGKVCQPCYVHMGYLKKPKYDSDINNIMIARNYFKKVVESRKVNQEVINFINDKIKEAAIEVKKYKTANERSLSFMTTTGYNFEGYRIINYLNVVSGEVVLGTGFLSELSSQINDFLGTSSSTFEGKIAKAKELALNNLKAKALDMEANAIIGIDFDIMTLANNMIVVSVNGTAVVIEKER